MSKKKMESLELHRVSAEALLKALKPKEQEKDREDVKRRIAYFQKYDSGSRKS